MFGRRKPEAQARRFAESLMALWMQGDWPRALNSVSHDGVDEQVLQGALSGLLRVAVNAPEAMQILNSRGEGDGPIPQAVRNCLTWMASDPASWGIPPSGTELEISLIEVSSALGQDRGCFHWINDQPSSAYSWTAR